ncbi:hypothetical protein C8Q76DRAFT_572075, partial [Earliella scabrosa]
FPPPPVSQKLLHETVAGFAKDVQISNFLESGCAVCGLLAPKHRMQNIDGVAFDRSL